jgi:hypothetical protein
VAALDGGDGNFWKKIPQSKICGQPVSEQKVRVTLFATITIHTIWAASKSSQFIIKSFRNDHKNLLEVF